MDTASYYEGPKRYPILGTYVNALSLDETVIEIEQNIQKGISIQHVVLNAAKINLMRSDPELTRIINECPIINADGASIIWAARKSGISLPERVPGIDLFLRLIEVAEKQRYGVYLFGAEENVVLRVRDIFLEKYPNLRITGYRNGYFDESAENEIIHDMASSGADMMFVAFSSPKKEYWIHAHMNEINIPFVMGVGGSFDVVAGVTTRAPKWMQNMGLEWLYRFLQEPRRLWKRYIVGNISFVMFVLRSSREKGHSEWSM